MNSIRTVIISTLLLLLCASVLCAQPRLEGKYRLKTKVHCAFSYNLYEKYELELNVDSLFILKTYSYVKNQRAAELREYHKYRGNWKIKQDTLMLPGMEELKITIKNGQLFLGGEQMQRKKGYFLFRRKTHRPLF
ncbi:MAG: hypothetical protein JWO44_1022 [Bacteroidetes bacterium]|nr:hypothetical protein [Bacteroidota bacterium]